jgi:hypothetical protein
MKTRLMSLIAVLAVGCGSPTPSVTLESFFPADNAVGTYVKDTSTAGLQVAKSNAAIEGLVDGDAAPFLEKGVLALGWEKYVSGTYKLDARVWQFSSATVATDVYGFLLTGALADGGVSNNVNLYKSATWTDLSVGQGGRFADTGSSYWLNAHKSAFLIEVKVTPKDATSRADLESFGNAIAAKIP